MNNLFELFVLYMSFFVSSSLLFYRFLELFRQVNTRLVGQANEHPEYVGHLFTHIVFLAFLKALPTSSVRTAILVNSEK